MPEVYEVQTATGTEFLGKQHNDNPYTHHFPLRLFIRSAKIMTTLDLLPQDILNIIACTTHDSLPALALVSKNLHRAINPLLYRFVHHGEYHKGAYSGEMQFPDWSSDFHQCTSGIKGMPRQDSKVARLDSFLRTIHDSPHLRALVLAASFGWSTPNDTVSNCIDILGSSVRFLHLNPPKYLEVHQMASVTSLEMHWKDLGIVVHHENNNGNRDKFYNLFRLPALTSLSLECVRSWSFFKGDASEFVDKIHTSNITCLNFPDSVPADRDLAEVLSWPKALQSYYHQVMPNEDSSYGPFSPSLSGAMFVDALQMQHDTLEEFFLSTSDDASGPTWKEGLVKIYRFPHLRRLGLQREFLVLSKVELGSEMECPSISTMLPPRLEQLQLEFSGETSLRLYFGSDGRSDALSFEPGELVEWLCDIARNKDSRYPNLKKVIMWRNDFPRFINPWVHMGQSRGYDQIKREFEKARINIVWWDCETSMLFSTN